MNEQQQKADPRHEIRDDIQNERTDQLMLKAAQMHGHYYYG